MSHMILVQAEVDELTKASAEKWLKGQGIVPDEAIRMFYREVVARHGLPFALDFRRAEEMNLNEISAERIPSVCGELRELQFQGKEMLERLQQFRAEKEMRKAARRAQREKARRGEGG